MMKTCFNWKVLVGLAVVGIGLFAFAPNLALGALPLLLLIACPLSMALMMYFMGKGMSGSQCEQKGQETPQASGVALTREEQIAQLRAQLQILQAQQTALNRQVADLEQAESMRPASGGPSTGKDSVETLRRPTASILTSGDSN